MAERRSQVEVRLLGSSASIMVVMVVASFGRVGGEGVVCDSWIKSRKQSAIVTNSEKKACIMLLPLGIKR